MDTRVQTEPPPIADIVLAIRRLSVWERIIASLLAEGTSVSDLAERLELRLVTAKAQLSIVFNKLGLPLEKFPHRQKILAQAFAEFVQEHRERLIPLPPAGGLGPKEDPADPLEAVDPPASPGIGITVPLADFKSVEGVASLAYNEEPDPDTWAGFVEAGYLPQFVNVFCFPDGSIVNHVLFVKAKK